LTKKYSLTAPDPPVINRNIILVITITRLHWGDAKLELLKIFTEKEWVIEKFIMESRIGFGSYLP
jgi:hypothetical protein